MIADYFSQNGTVQRKIDELFPALSKSKRFYEMKKFLCDVNIFHTFYNKQTKFTCKKFWLEISKDYQVAEEYKEAIEVFIKTAKPSKEQVTQLCHTFSSSQPSTPF
jgi:hypothetical protein